MRKLIIAGLALGALAGCGHTQSHQTELLSSNPCQVGFTYTSDSATAHLSAACSGEFTLTSWVAQSHKKSTSGPQTLFAQVTGEAPEITVSLPPCYWQVDLTQNGEQIRGHLGGQPCTTVTPTTTATSPVTTPSETSTSTATTTKTVPSITTRSSTSSARPSAVLSIPKPPARPSVAVSPAPVAPITPSPVKVNG